MCVMRLPSVRPPCVVIVRIKLSQGGGGGSLVRDEPDHSSSDTRATSWNVRPLECVDVTAVIAASHRDIMPY